MMHPLRLVGLAASLLAIPMVLGGCPSREPECFECGLSEQWDRIERERALRRAEQAAEQAEAEDGEAEQAEAEAEAEQEQAEGEQAGGVQAGGESEADADREADAGGGSGSTLDESCRPLTQCPEGRRGMRCGELGCPGATMHCGCQRGLSCRGGVCMRAHRTCDPMSPKDVCPEPAQRGDACGAVSAGCPNVTVTCRCASGLTCVDGRCR